MTTALVTDSKEWTPEQQKQEFTRRMNLLGLGKEVMPPFTPHPDDVVCAVPYKSGTSWMMHICHQIRMQGAEPTFQDQTTVVCWIEYNKVLHGVDPDDVLQPVQPRLFATHLSDYDVIPQANRIIYSFRDQMDALYSLYCMMDTLLLFKGRIPLALFADTFVDSGLVRKRIEQLLGWWKRRHQNNVLLMFYDDLKEDHTGSVRKIAKFIDVDCTDEVIARVVKTTSHAEMSKHSSKFDARSFSLALAQQIGEEPEFDTEDYVARVRKDGGRSGDGKILPLHIQEYYDQQWKEIITAELGFNNLKEMRDAWHKEQKH